MNEPTWPALLTGTITPDPEAISLLNDPRVRRNHYHETLSWMGTARTDIDTVVFCENSSSPLDDFEPLLPLYRQHGRSLALYSVPMPGSPFRGKGWGEGLILLWALQNVANLKTAEGFFKITGRYRILNLSRVVAVIRRGLRDNPNLKFVGHTFTDHPTVHVHSDFFWCNRKFYLTHLADVYEAVNDVQGNYIEHALAERLLTVKDQEDIAILQTPLLIQGVAGWNRKPFIGMRKYLREEIGQRLTPLPSLRYLPSRFTTT